MIVLTSEVTFWWSWSRQTYISELSLRILETWIYIDSFNFSTFIYTFSLESQCEYHKRLHIWTLNTTQWRLVVCFLCSCLEFHLACVSTRSFFNHKCWCFFYGQVPLYIWFNYSPARHKLNSSTTVIEDNLCTESYLRSFFTVWSFSIVLHLWTEWFNIRSICCRYLKLRFYKLTIQW